MSATLILDNVRKTYPRAWLKPPVEAVCGVSLEIEQGEVFGFVGPNGAGKSTIIKILTGVLHATSGRVLINGMDVADCRARNGLGFVPENPYLNDYMTPLEVLLMGVRIHRLKLVNEKIHCMSWLARFGLTAAANRRIRTFSKGMTQRTALAHALAIRPRFLVLDEPLSGLDPVGRKEVVDILSEYKKEGGTVFLTSHVLHDVERLADRFGLIHKGQLKTVQSPSELSGGDEIVTVRSIGSTAVAGMRMEAVGRWVDEIPRSSLWSLLLQLEQAGHSLIEVKPTLSLESAFMRYVSEN